MTPTHLLPPETAPQRAVWCSWPGNPSTWADCRESALTAYACLVTTLTRYQPVELICPAPWQPSARMHLKRAGANPDRISWHNWPLNDAWCRDHAPLFMITPAGNVELLDLPYNAWGGKFPPWDDDDRIASRISELRNLPLRRFPYFGEGGALEIGPDGLLLTTESVWLNPNRNPGLTREAAEKAFQEFIGIRETFWLPGGMPGDDTDGHIDTLARFLDAHTVVAPLADSGHPDAKILRRNLDLLAERFEVKALPHPAPRPDPSDPDRLLPQSYANYLVMNDAVLVPTYAQPENDARALDVLGKLFPERTIEPIPCEILIREGGAVHCLTMQEPLCC